MSFQNLLDGDCGGQNPLVKIGNHFTQDQSFRQERVHPLSPDFSQAELLVHEFLEDNLGQNVQTFRMDELFRELRDMESTTTRSSINQAPNVAQLASEETSSLWSKEFLNDKAKDLAPQYNVSESPSVQCFEQDVTAPRLDNTCALKPDRVKPVQVTLNDLNDTWSVDFEKMKSFDESQFGLGKEWVENFLKDGDIESSSEETLPKDMKQEDGGGSSKFIKFMQSCKREDIRKQAEEWSEEFTNKVDETQLNEIWKEESGGASVENDEYSNQFWKKLQKEWEKLSEQEGGEPSWEKEYSEFIDPFKEYSFENENPMNDLESPFEEGLRKLKENDLPSAVLCFEAAAQAEPNNPLVWQFLGTTQAENEQDPFAIAALKKCIALQHDNLIALMSLAISYTNENYQNQACHMLKEWIYHNPKYSDLVQAEKDGSFRDISSLLSPNIYNEVRDLYIKAANKYPHGEIDADVQCGLGVLFNLSDEFDNAVDCFKTALQARPKDFRMWNRLGATLANGHRSEEAVDAYYNALHLSPGFIRARYNIGITCINLGANKEAAEHLLTALNQQAKVNTKRGKVGSMSESIWTTLKFVVNLLGKYELLQAVESRHFHPEPVEMPVKFVVRQLIYSDNVKVTKNRTVPFDDWRIFLLTLEKLLLPFRGNTHVYLFNVETGVYGEVIYCDIT